MRRSLMYSVGGSPSRPSAASRLRTHTHRRSRSGSRSPSFALALSHSHSLALLLSLSRSLALSPSHAFSLLRATSSTHALASRSLLPSVTPPCSAPPDRLQIASSHDLRASFNSRVSPNHA
eukprot:6028638-Pleurochrysis_carterae.AAC.1